MVQDATNHSAGKGKAPTDGSNFTVDGTVQMVQTLLYYQEQMKLHAMQ
jgi:hypothetical protein